MQKALFIAEKNSVLQVAKQVYEKHRSEFSYSIDFLCQSGHLLRLLYPHELNDKFKTWSWDALPFTEKDLGGYRYEPIEKTKNLYDKIKKTLKENNYDFIIHGGDSDQEGELLVRLVLNKLNVKTKAYRYWESGISEDEVLHSLKNIKPLNTPMYENLYLAGLARQSWDYLMGMNGSRCVSLATNDTENVGRIKAFINNLVRNREKEVDSFIPKTSYQIIANYKEGFSGILFNNRQKQKEDDIDESSIIQFNSEKEAADFCDKLNKNSKVIEVLKRNAKQKAPKLFKMSTLEIAAGKLGYSVKQADDTLQSLYLKGITSYPRTDCDVISDKMDFKKMFEVVKAVPGLAEYVRKITSEDLSRVLKDKKYVNNAITEKLGHQALVPLGTKPFVYSTLTKEEKDILYLICRQFLAIFLKPLSQDKTMIITENNGYTFKTNGKTLVDRGYTILFDTKIEDVILPDVRKGQVITVNDFDIGKTITTKPKYFTIPTIIEAMDNPQKYFIDPELRKSEKDLSISTPSTRAKTIEELIIKGYLVVDSKEPGYVKTTEKGKRLAKNLKGTLITEADMTALLEEKLKLIRTGEYSKEQFDREADEFVANFVRQIKDREPTFEKGEKSTPTTKDTGEGICLCPICKSPIQKNSKGYGCINYMKHPKEKVFIPYNVSGIEFTEKDAIDLISEKIITKKIKRSVIVDQRMKIDFTSGGVLFIDGDFEIDLKCPKCKNSMSENGVKIKCNHCDIEIWKTVAGKQIPKTQLKKLITNFETDEISGLKGSNGLFNATLYLTNDYKVTFKKGLKKR